MPNLYPGIKPVVGNGRPCVLLFAILFLPFFVFAQPVITSFTPHSGAVGSTVTITGTNFSPTASADIVYFGSVKANVTAATATSLTVTVPTGISYAPLTVTTGGLTAFSAQPFITTFSDPGQFTPQAFSTRSDIPSGLTPESIFTTDIDGDGKPDLVVANGDGNSMDIFLNTSTPQNINFTMVLSYPLEPGYYPIAITAGDLDGDGRPDIVVATYQSPKLALFRNTSTPGSVSVAGPTGPSSYKNIGNYTTGATIADCNGDGKPEIILASNSSDWVSVFPNNSTIGTLSFGTRKDLSTGAAPSNVIAMDLDGDGKPDLASVNTNSNTVSVFRNTSITGGALSFDHPAGNDFSVGSSPTDLAVADLDGDGKPELAVVNNNDATITLLQNTCTPGTINFARGTDVPTGSMTPGSPWALRIGDFDGDGKPDIATLNNSLENIVAVHRNISTAGSPAIDANVNYGTGDFPYALAVADYDGDGLPDLAIIDNTSNYITLLRNKSSNEASITSFTPTSGGSGTVVTITGANLNGATSVTFGGVAASSFTVNSATSITATVGSGATGQVTVLTPAGSASLGTFTYGAPTLVITNFSPTSAGPGTTVTINGSNFTGATNVSFGASPAASFTVVSDNQVTAIVGNGSSGPVTVAAGTNSGQAPGFTYLPPAISITSFSPASGSTGTAVVIKGHGFLNADSVYFGNVSASRITISGDTTITAYVASGSSGSVVVVGTSGMDSQSGFTYINNSPPPPPPSTLISITSFSPASGKMGDTLHIRGTNLNSTNTVTLGGTPARFQAISDSVLIAIVGAGSTGAVMVANSTNADSLLLFTFLYDTTKQGPPGAFQLIQFSGLISGNDNRNLTWQVKNDAGIAYYAVERSSDSVLFTVIGTVKSTRSNGVSHTYTYTDADAANGTNWYRLKMQDTTASYTYSTKIRIKPPSQLIHPNPAKYGFFNFDVPDAGDASVIRLVDMGGQVLQSVNVAAGISELRVDIPGLSAGTYRVSWTNGKKSVSTTLLVLKP